MKEFVVALLPAAASCYGRRRGDVQVQEGRVNSRRKHELGDGSGAGGCSGVYGRNAAAAATSATASAVSSFLPGRHHGCPHVLGLLPSRVKMREMTFTIYTAGK